MDPETPKTVADVKAFLKSRGIIITPGPRDNATDCETDKILTHAATGEQQRFHGSWWDKPYSDAMIAWARKFPVVSMPLLGGTFIRTDHPAILAAINALQICSVGDCHTCKVQRAEAGK